MSPRKLLVRNKYKNVVLTGYEPQEQFDLYGDAFWNAAKRLLQNDELDRSPIASFDATVIVYLYHHSLTKLLSDVRRIYAACGWDIDPNSAITFDHIAAIVDELEGIDPSSTSFRYPMNRSFDGAALGGPIVFSVRKFASTMDEVLGTFSGACDLLSEIANGKARVAYEARCKLDFESD